MTEGILVDVFKFLSSIFLFSRKLSGRDISLFHDSSGLLRLAKASLGIIFLKHAPKALRWGVGVNCIVVGACNHSGEGGINLAKGRIGCRFEV